MVSSVWVDGVGKVAFVGGAVRVEFQAVDLASVSDQTAKVAPVQQIVMSPETLVRTVTALQQLVMQLQQNGALASSALPAAAEAPALPAAAAPSPSASAPKRMAPAGSPVSPNF